jgi:hypothetical protein
VKSIKVYGPISLSKDTLKEKGTPWLIKCSGEGKFSDVGYFNTPPYVWQLMAEHMDNNGREMHIIARNLWLWYHVKVYRHILFSKDALREEGTLWLIKCLGRGNLSDVKHFNKKFAENHIYLHLVRVVLVLRDEIRTFGKGNKLR